MLRSVFYLFVLLMLLCAGKVKGQCPINIGFDQGDFTGWEGYTGNVLADGTISVPDQGIVNGRHTIITRASKQVDPYGMFSLASPNGSDNIVKLGNESAGHQAERLTYTFTVPNDVNDYSLIYYYAVVFQDFGHTPVEQPKFTANVYNVTKGAYADCGSFKFVASKNLPGFQKSALNDIVFYKDWSAVTINLAGYAGNTLRLEFTTNDCTHNAHFGYAYIDINQNCNSPVSGNYICEQSKSLTLTAPSGFAAYYWYNGTDFSKVVHNENTYTISPIPPVGTKYSVRIVPYPGIGCEDIITTTIKKADHLTFKVVDSIVACSNSGANIKSPDITKGSSPDFYYNYYTDSLCTNFVTDPAAIMQSGKYYIQANSLTSGCTYVQPIKVVIISPKLTIHDPLPVCEPAVVDITLPAVTSGSVGADSLSYWKDSKATIRLDQPTQIKAFGTYYIKAINKSTGCDTVKPVNVFINSLPVLQTHTTFGCNTADITADSVTRGSNYSGSLTYWKDEAATIPLDYPKAITSSNTYYIRATNNDCPVTSPVIVRVFLDPEIEVHDPPSVVFPTTVDITQTFIYNDTTRYFYYRDSLATKTLANPDKVTRAGTYYIKAVNGNNCEIVRPVKVDITKPPDVNYSINTFTPNGDSKNDIFHISIPPSIKLNHFRVYGPWGGLLFETSDPEKGWDGTSNGKKMPVGTYYWIFEGYDTYINQAVKKSGSISIVM